MVRPIAIPSPARPSRLFLTGCLLALAMPACASSGRGDPVGSDRNLLTQEEVLESNSQDVYSVIQERRPRWIRSGQALSLSDANPVESVVVYFEQSRQGGPEVLRGMPLSGISEIRFYSGLEAQQRFGLDHRLGAIVVSFSPRS